MSVDRKPWALSFSEPPVAADEQTPGHPLPSIEPVTFQQPPAAAAEPAVETAAGTLAAAGLTFSEPGSQI